MLASLVGWIFTEMARQPWIVFGLMLTEDGVSPNVTGLEVLISLVAFTAIYGALAVVNVKLIVKAAQTIPDSWDKSAVDTDDRDASKLQTVY
jgi:cytochrome d ubiquinol oxidase subunit I